MGRTVRPLANVWRRSRVKVNASKTTVLDFERVGLS